MDGYDLTDFERSVIQPLLPNKPRGAPRVDERRVLNGIFWVLRTGASWRALSKEYGPHTNCYNRFVRWRRVGVWDRIMSAVTETYDGSVQMIDTTSVRVHQHAANSKKVIRIAAWAARAAG
jgi:transposase